MVELALAPLSNMLRLAGVILWSLLCDLFLPPCQMDCGDLAFRDEEVSENSRSVASEVF
jgi:hypothetical protein